MLTKKDIQEIYDGKLKPSKGFHTPPGWNDVDFLHRLHQCNMGILKFVPNGIANKDMLVEQLKKAMKLEKKK